MPVELPTTTPAAPPRDARKSPRPITGAHVLIGLLLFFGVIFAVNAVMVTVALRTMPGTEVKSAYEASQRFNRELDAAEAQDQLGWQVDVTTARMRAGALAVELRDRSGAPLAGLEVLARIERPTDAKLDQRVKLFAEGAGRYVAEFPALAAGQWLLTIEARESGARRFLSQRKVLLRD